MSWILNEVINPEIIFKIILALLLSLVIGVEREIKKKPIGLKTSAVIATFSCLLTIVSIEAAYLVPARDDINITMDPLRLSAQIVSGIGFLGAGAILRRDNDNITGLTTAAMIWGSASIGIAIGAGFYLEAIIAVIGVMLVIEILSPMLSKYGPKRLRSNKVVFTITLLDKLKIDELLSYLTAENMFVEKLRIRQTSNCDESFAHELELRLSSVSNKPTPQLYLEITDLPYVESVSIEILS